MTPKRVAAIVCSVLFVTTLILVGLTYRSNLNEASDLLTQYSANTQHFDRTKVTTVIEEIRRDEEESGETPWDDLMPTYPIPGNPTPGNGDILEVPDNLQDIIMMPNDEAWKLCTNGLFTDYPSVAFNSIESQLKQLQSTASTKITVPAWKWSGGSGMKKESTQITIECNRVVAPLLQAIMQDIYDHPTQPVMTYAGCYYVRAKTSGGKPSAHAFGCAIDFNASSALGGYGNIWRGKIPTKEQWDALPESREKHEIFYIDCPVVTIFKAYGFCWGGDFRSSKDGMHFSFIGDYDRDEGQKNYANYSGRRP